MCDGCKANKTRAKDRARASDHRRRLRTYGITDEWLQVTLESQGGRCAICRTNDPTSGTRKHALTWAIDHDHATGVARGLLCHRCNLAIGQFDDDPDLLRAAIAYLERNRMAVAS